MTADRVQTILVVEDQDDVQKLLALALERPGRRVLHALDAEEGARLVAEERPDLVLLDIMMPGRMDGLALLRQIRADEKSRDIKVIVLSARAQNQDKQVARDAGADDYLVKPFRLVSLQEMVSRYLPNPGS